MFFLLNIGSKDLAEESTKRLEAGQSAMDVVDYTLRCIENDPVETTVGYGGLPDITGRVTLDAAIMHGPTQTFASIGCLEGYAHPISVARALWDVGIHTMLVGDGAAQFAQGIGAEQRNNLTTEALLAWQQRMGNDPLSFQEMMKKHREIISPDRHPRDEGMRDTAICLVQDKAGEIVVGTTTSGWPFKLHGRLGDSPICGAGFYANQKIAIACTHTGEMTQRCSTARTVALLVDRGLFSLEDAVAQSIQDLSELQGGLLGPVAVYAVDHAGNHCAMFLGDPSSETTSYWFWKDGAALLRQTVSATAGRRASLKKRVP